MPTSLILILIALPLSAIEESKGSAGNFNRDFGFWIGEWETEASVMQDWTAIKQGTDSVRCTLNGRLIEEVFFKEEGVSFQRGYLSYLQGQNLWHHVIYDEKWGMYIFEGKMEDGKMVLTSTDKRPGLRRETFYNITDDSFDYLWEGSSDGETWSPVWRVKYKRKVTG